MTLGYGILLLLLGLGATVMVFGVYLYIEQKQMEKMHPPKKEPNPLDRFTAVSTLSANLLPSDELIIILSTSTEMSCLIFLFISGTLSIS